MFECKVDGCQAKRHKAKGYCAFHYERHLKGIPMDKPRRRYNPGSKCEIEGCDNTSRAKGLCQKHWMRWRKHGDSNFTKHSRAYGSGREWHEGPIGYIARFEPSNPNAGSNGQVYQHRHVMSEIVGRPLLPHENVHHINGDKSDNCPENLELWDKPQPPGQRVTDRVEWCIEYLSSDALPAALRLQPELAGALAALVLKLNTQ